MTKPCVGRQKITISKIPKKNHLQLTKRHTRLFKITIFPPANKAFSFGHPNVDSIIDCYFAQDPKSPSESGTNKLIEAHRNANIRELNMHLTRHGEVLNEIRKASRSQCWWEAPINELGLHELEKLKTAMEDVKKNVEQQANKILINSKNNPSPFF
ncbi:hypothetical protein CICLE_v10023796mg, partial [Citrus x clementina]